MIKALGHVSRTLSSVTGGAPGQTLCGRMAVKYGHDCIFCRIVGWFLKDSDHCWDERIKELKRCR